MGNVMIINENDKHENLVQKERKKFSIISILIHWSYGANIILINQIIIIKWNKWMNPYENKNK